MAEQRTNATRIGIPSVLLTRAKHQAERFAQELRQDLDLSVGIVVSPVLRIDAVPHQVAWSAEELLVFTSENAVHAVSHHSNRFGQPALCVGRRTAEAARAVGFDAAYGGKTVGAVYQALREHTAARPVLYIRGAEVSVDLVAQLHAAGHAARDAIVYRQVPQRLNAQAQALLTGSDPVVLPVFSTRSGTLLAAQLNGALAPFCVVAISGTVAQAWPRRMDRIEIAARPDAVEMRAAVARAVQHRVP